MKMKCTTIAFACLAAASTLLPGSAFAQSVFAQQGEITTADAAAKLLQPADNTAPTGLSSELAKSETAPGTTLEEKVQAMDPYAAEAGPLTLFNCSGATIKVKTFNSNDTMLWVAFKEQSIANGASAGLKCATSSCKLKVNSGGATAAMSGYQVFIGGAVKATNQAAMAKGCAVYAN